MFRKIAHSHIAPVVISTMNPLLPPGPNYKNLALRALSCSGSFRNRPDRQELSPASLDLIGQLEQLIEKNYAVHPFQTLVRKDNEQAVLAHYLAMSEAFPFIQAGAYRNLILQCIKRNQGISESVEKTFVVGSFLSFDETGGNYLLRTEGISALPRVLDTKKQYHAQLLKKDMQTLYGKEIEPNYLDPTASYLLTLLDNLGSFDPLKRCASMVAFEMHAGEMIQALWDSLSALHRETKKDHLEYFKVHVGGDDPQEEYHKQLTKRMTAELIPPHEKDCFLEHFMQCYEQNLVWCQKITQY